MSAMIALRRERVSAGMATRVDELPMWIAPQSRKGLYWHIPRSAMDFGDRLSISMWCGVSFNVRRVRAGEPPEGAKCGTCSGRYEGAEGFQTPRHITAQTPLMGANHCSTCDGSGHRPAIFVKQLGAKPLDVKLIDGKGGDLDEWPPDLRIREWPSVVSRRVPVAI